MDKTLDVFSFHAGIDEVLRKLDTHETGLSELAKSVNSIISLNDSLKGKGGDSIRSFYESCHAPILLRLKSFLASYKSQLLRLKSVLDGLEPARNGFISESSLNTIYMDGIEKITDTINGYTDEANACIGQITDIVSVALIDDQTFSKSAEDAKKEIKSTVEKLDAFDKEQTAALTSLANDAVALMQYCKEIEGMFLSGKDVIRNFNIKDVKDNPIYSAFVSDTNQKVKHYLKGDDEFSFLAGVSSDEDTGLRNLSSPQEDGSGYLAGAGSSMGDPVKLTAGVGYYKNKWGASFNSIFDYELGGNAAFSLLRADASYNGEYVDSSFKMDVLNAGITAKIGGNSWGDSPFPLLKAEANGISAKARVQIDPGDPSIPRAGLEFSGKVGTAKAYAGVDGKSFGVGAKAGLLEGDASIIVPTIFPGENLKFTAGASWGGIGGEAKIGKEISVDLRAWIGVKVGIGLEEQPNY